jgi:hypothetical protein
MKIKAKNITVKNLNVWIVREILLVDWPKAIVIFDSQDAAGLMGKLAREMPKSSANLNDTALRRELAALNNSLKNALVAQQVLTQSFTQKKSVA